jgi:hypothetical protein
MHAEDVGPAGVAYISGRRRNGGPLTREAFESDLRREGFEVVHGGQKPAFTEDLHAHDFDVRIMVLSVKLPWFGTGWDVPDRRSLRDFDGVPAHHEGGPARRRRLYCGESLPPSICQLNAGSATVLLAAGVPCSRNPSP